MAMLEIASQACAVHGRVHTRSPAVAQAKHARTVVAMAFSPSVTALCTNVCTFPVIRILLSLPPPTSPFLRFECLPIPS